MRKYADDAQKGIVADRDRRHVLRQQREAVRNRYHIAKRCLLGVALAGVACGLYYAHDLGGLMATNMSSTQFAAPVVESAPASKAKQKRKISESRREREQDLEEIESF